MDARSYFYLCTPEGRRPYFAYLARSIVSSDATTMDRPSTTPISNDPSFPRDAPVNEQLAFLLQYAVMAPSGHNTQPWQFSIRDDAIWLYADPALTLPALDPGGRERIMSCGAALFHLRIAMIHAGFDPLVELFPDGGAANAATDDASFASSGAGQKALARIRMGEHRQPSLLEERLFSAIHRRRTHREAFADANVADADIEALQEAAEQEGATLEIVTGADRRQRLLDLVIQGNEIMLADPDVRRELAEWTSRVSDKTGVVGKSRGWSRWQTATARWLHALPGGHPDPWRQETAMIRSAPVLGILATANDHVPDWLTGGQALDRVLLRATSFGLAASFLNQPVKVDRLRNQLHELLTHDGVPQIILRMGVVTTQEPRSGRQPVPVRSD